MAERTATVTKPSRSDDVPGVEQQLAIADRVRAQFDSIAPKRPLKPIRSESDHSAAPPQAFADQPIPELDKLRSLRSQSEGLFGGIEGSPPGVVEDDFVETRYYKEMHSIDKQHHTTGNGFIKVASDEYENGYGYGIKLGSGVNGGFTGVISRSNPATNDWVPSGSDHVQVYVSSKPRRSESD